MFFVMEMIWIRYYPTWNGTHKTVGHTAKKGLESKLIHWDKNVNMKFLNIHHYKLITQKFKLW